MLGQTLMNFRDYLLALFTSILWGGNFIATKYGIDGFGIFGLSLVRVLSVSILFLPYLSFEQIIFKNIIKIALVYGIGFLTFVNVSIEYTDNLPLIIILIQIVVPIGAVLSYFYFNERIIWQEVLGMTIAFFGVVILVGVPSNLEFLISIIAVLIAAFSQAWQMVLVKKYAYKVETKNLLAWVHLLNLPLFVFLAIFLDDLSLNTLKEISFTTWLGALYAGVISTAIGFGIWFSLLKKYPVNKVTPFMLFVPFFGILLSRLFFNSALTKEVIVGGMLIILGVVIIQFFRRIPKRNPAL
jgi:O-acetylserine/cysteine efflux transporter